MKFIWLISFLFLSGCDLVSSSDRTQKSAEQKVSQQKESESVSIDSQSSFSLGHTALLKATFAGGCFWCMEAAFEEFKGVLEVVSGYSGGQAKNPTYEQVSGGATQHLEVIQVTYDPHKVTYQELLDHFWRNVDPTDAQGQFVDRGSQYGTAIFYHDSIQKKLAEASKKVLNESGRYSKAVITPIRKYENFYPAESYHQDYYKENPVRYKFYKHSSGRPQYLKKVWGKDKKSEPSEAK